MGSHSVTKMGIKMQKYDPNHTFVTRGHHFRDWTCYGGALAEGAKEEEMQRIPGLNLRLIHVKEEAKDTQPGLRMRGPPPEEARQGRLQRRHGENDEDIPCLAEEGD